MRQDSYIGLAAKKLIKPSRLKKQVAGRAEGDASLSKTAGSLADQKEQTAMLQTDADQARMSKLLRKMTNVELQNLLASDDDAGIDFLLESNSTIRKLSSERDELQQEVNDLARFNYAREPEFARDRMKLRETLDSVAPLKHRIASRNANRILDKLAKVERLLADKTRRCEEDSEQMAMEFLEGRKDYDAFICDYVKIRQDAHRKRVLADRLAKDKANMVATVTATASNNRSINLDESPRPASRQKKRVSINK